MDEVDPSLNASSLPFVEEMYLAYLRDPGEVPADWRAYFDALPANGEVAGRESFGPSFPRRSLFHAASGALTETASEDPSVADAELTQRLGRLIRNFRVRGHRVADLNPLGPRTHVIPEIDPSYYGITASDMDKRVLSTTFASASTVGDVIDALRETYTRAIGVQFMHIDDLELRKWLQARMERTRNRLEIPRETQLRILTKLTDAVMFEEFIQKKYVGAKSFSLEGGESLIPLLDLALEKAGAQGVRDVVIGMAHRGRLNVLANIMGKNPRAIFREFEDKDPELLRGRGDVKYHLGYSNDWVTQAGDTIHMSLAFNPSHLEYVNPVAMGRVRAKQDRAGDERRERGLVVLIHGDASFIGEGVVQETLNMSELEGYQVGGALHVIVNNQIGFTTGPQQGRSTTYASDAAKILQSPILHVNGEDPEAVAQVIELAMDFRDAFKRDVVIDMYCYRRWGHNEGDEPSFTQPAMYERIRKRDTVREGYLERLLTLGGITREEAEEITEARRQQLEQELSVARGDEFKPHYSAFEGVWQGFSGGLDREAPEVDTAVDEASLERVLEALVTLPEGFTANPKMLRFLQQREQMARGERRIDWATGEALAFGSLLMEGHRVRLSGQDSERGTFSQRHSVLHDAFTGERFVPLAQLARDGAVFDVHNSPLSEQSVVGFEYGYSLDWPDGLVAWEAQFGDFVNSAQVYVDQFLASGEEKWRRLSGLVLLLPHGFEGAGPEHSSARLERFLQLCADDNMQVAYPTTPANYFHLLRRQVLRPWRKPLVVMTPKSLLRNPAATSTLEEMSAGGFERLIPDRAVDPARVTKVLMCSGKVYYELVQRREESGRDDVAILRLEQLYPLDDAQVAEALDVYPEDAPVTWVQEEPANMGAWTSLRMHWCERVAGRPFALVSRPPRATPATGSTSSHKIEQAELLRTALEETR